MKTLFLILAYANCTYSIFSQSLSLFPVSAPLEQGTAYIEAVPMNMNPVSSEIKNAESQIDKGMEGSLKTNELSSSQEVYIRGKQLASPQQLLGSAIEQHICKLDFTSATKNGKKIAKLLNMKLHFNLTN
ncbi:MAG: hypothetical protein AAGC85_22765 [Bacteroidota bacterium]